MCGISGVISRARGIFLRESLSKVVEVLTACHFVSGIHVDANTGYHGVHVCAASVGHWICICPATAGSKFDYLLVLLQIYCFQMHQRPRLSPLRQLMIHV
jgi:hypothetical protein